VVIFGRSKYGIKISGIGHNGEARSKEELMKHLLDLLSIRGYWAESEGVPALLCLKRNVPIVHDIEIINRIFPSTDAKFADTTNTWYERIKHGVRVKKILCGTPII